MKIGVYLFLLLFCVATRAADHPLLTRTLASDRAPPGVVFEIATGDVRGLDWALPEAADASRRLRAKFPGLPIVILIRSLEMFALQTSQRAAAPTLHAAVERLVRKENIPVEIDATYAGWQHVAPAAFPDYVIPVPDAAQRLRGLLDRGFVRIKISGALNGMPAQ